MISNHKKFIKFDRINVEIVNTCNLKCTFCPTPLRPKMAMSPDDFVQIISKIKPITNEVVLHLLGEPLSHPQLDQIIAAASTHEVPINVVTNGLLLVGAKVDLLLQPIIRQVSISLQSFANNFSDTDPRTYILRIKSFVERAQSQRPDLYLNLRFWDLPPDRNFVPPQTNHNQDVVETDAEQSALTVLRDVVAEEFKFSWQDVSINLRNRKSHRLNGRLYLHFDSRFTWPKLDQPVLQTKGTCHGLSKHFGIHADGTVVPCCLDHNADIPLGNIFKESIGEILSSSRAVTMRDGFAKGQLVEDLCRRCGYIARFGS